MKESVKIKNQNSHRGNSKTIKFFIKSGDFRIVLIIQKLYSYMRLCQMCQYSGNNIFAYISYIP